MQNETLDHVPESTRPGLTALLTYLRPISRGALLANVTSMGIFVVEHQGRDGALDAGRVSRADLAVIVADAEPEHVEFAREIVTGLTASTLILLPPGVPGSAYANAGIAAWASDDDEAGVRRALAAVARTARQVGARSPESPEMFVFGDIQLRLHPSTLVKDGRVVALSDAEREVLLRLSASGGRPVRPDELAANLEMRGGNVDPGDVKAIVLRIRRKVERLGGDPFRLGTVRGLGYFLMR